MDEFKGELPVKISNGWISGDGATFVVDFLAKKSGILYKYKADAKRCLSYAIDRKTKAQIKGEFCETIVSDELRLECSKVIPLRRGADYPCVKDSGDISFVEAKCKKSQLTDFQKKFSALVEALGLK